MSLKNIDFEKLKADMEEATTLLIMVTDDYIEAMKNPEDIEHVALSYQLQQAAKGTQDVYILAMRPLARDNFSLLMDMLEGSKLKTVVFIDKDDKEDMDRAVRLIRTLMAGLGQRVSISGTSKDSWIKKDE